MIDVEKEVKKIKARNSRVELDKAWETSLSRKITIAVLTYFVHVVFFHFAGLPKPFVNSIFPAMAVVLSMLSLPFIKKVWIKMRK